MPLSYSMSVSWIGPASGSRGDLDLAETDQREMPERRNETALGQLHALGAGEPSGVARPGKIGGAEAQPGHDRLQALLDEAAHAAVGGDAGQDDQFAAGTHHAGELV